MFRIWKSFTFAAAHQLNGLPPDHQCSRMHGHNYLVELELSSPDVDARGFVLDYGELKPFQDFIDDTWDHRTLNEVVPFVSNPGHNPSAENMAEYLFNLAVRLFGRDAITAVRVQETPRSWAEYSE